MANAAAKAGGSRKTAFLIALLVILVAAVAAVNVYLLLDQRGEAQASGPQEAQVQSPTPIFVRVDPFTVNLQSNRYSDRLLYVGLTLKVGDEVTQEIIQEHLPLVRSRLLLLFSEQLDEDLKAPGGRQALAQQVLTLFDEPLTRPQPTLAVEEVLFTEFIVQ
ncbi:MULTISPECIES: flagellar basal body-associated protein FliL [Halomonadaceae]|uniref:flagellar basal body-associated protein FliL n=1 Tax=Halomonas TaxID=2745 RepID=UPI0018A77E3E|nr:flagellar basal body-associated protein FliL [Halomonas sp. 328]MBF8222265.1 flagellar basal body-associated protein FliL [Halomonas sp. 328]